MELNRDSQSEGSRGSDSGATKPSFVPLSNGRKSYSYSGGLSVGTVLTRGAIGGGMASRVLDIQNLFCIGADTTDE